MSQLLSNHFETAQRAIREAEREYRRATDPRTEPRADGGQLATIIRDGRPVTVRVWNRQHPYRRFARLLDGTFTDLSDSEWNTIDLADGDNQ